MKNFVKKERPCEECGNSYLLYDSFHAETFCPKCGLVE